MLVIGQGALEKDPVVSENIWAIIATVVTHILSTYHVPGTKFSVRGVEPLGVTEVRRGDNQKKIVDSNVKILFIK